MWRGKYWPRTRRPEGDVRADGHVFVPPSQRHPGTTGAQKGLPRERVRQPGGGRKRLEESDPGLQTALERIMEENTRRRPDELVAMDEQIDGSDCGRAYSTGSFVGDETVRRRLADMGYSLQANVKNLEESAAGRDRQFRYSIGR